MMVRFTLSLAFVIITTFFPGQLDAIKDGKLANRCDYPGLAVVTTITGALQCTGVIVEPSTLILPKLCQITLSGMSGTQDLFVKVEKTTWTIKKGGYTATPSDGVVRINLVGNPNIQKTVDKSADCFKEGTLYDGTEALNDKSCVVLGYGADTNTGAKTYAPSNLKAAPITKSTSAKCCNDIRSTLTPEEAGGVTGNDADPYNCLTSSGATCGIGDVGAPIMCDTVSAKKVIIGLNANQACKSNQVFMAHDLTNRSNKVKFGTFKK